jgi:pantoate--beta-alanine ligase
MLTLSSPQVVQETALRWKMDGKKVAIVPTMGALHEGHLALVAAAKALAPKVIVSIFVNPLQFGPKEDFNKYPRPLDADTEKLQRLDVDVLFNPSDKEFYPETFVTQVKVAKITDALCAKFRPGHFEGVATVCLKLFQITQADFAVFGEKDYQQLRVLQQLTADLNLPLTIVPHVTIREPDGLALSSRNAYLSSTERTQALALHRACRTATALLMEKPSSTVGDLLDQAARVLEFPEARIEYLEIASETDLQTQPRSTKLLDIPSPRLFMAVWLGKTRLIDNQPLDFRLREGLMHSPERLA